PDRARGQHVVPPRALVARLRAQHVRPQPQPAPLRHRGGRCLAAPRRRRFRRVQPRAPLRRAYAGAADDVPARASAATAGRARGIDLRDPDRRLPLLLREGGRPMNESSSLPSVSRRSLLATMGGAAAALLASRAPAALAQPAPAIKRGGTFVESINWTY